MRYCKTRPLVGVAFLLSGFCSGCSKPAPVAAPQKTAQNTIESELETVRDSFNRPHPDADFLRNSLNQLNGIFNAEPQRRPAPLPPEEVAFLNDRLKLSEGQVKEINAPEFAPIDAHILDQALLFRDVARTLELSKQPPLVKATVALDWVSRHVRLEERNGPPDPPDRVVLRARGTALERIYVYSALLQQLDVEAYCVGDEAAANDANRLWGVGVMNGDQVALFDPRFGLALPGTLVELQTDTKPLESLVALGYDVTPQMLKDARFYPSWPINCFAPRWKTVESMIRDHDLHIQIDVNRLMKTANKHRLGIWSANTPGSPIRVLAEFLPTEDGGLDRAPAGPRRRLALFQAETIPWPNMPREFFDLQGPLGAQLRLAFVEIAWRDQQPGIAEIVRQKKRFAQNRRELELQEKRKELPTQQLIEDVFIDIQASRRSGDEQGPTLMELLLRGQNAEATETMVELTSDLTKMRQQALAPADAQEWLKKAQTAFVDLLKAQRTNDGAALQELQTRFVTLGREAKPAVDIVQQSAAGPMLARLMYLIALSKHDQADVNSRQNPKTDWKTAIHAWNTFLSNHPDSPDAVHAQRNLAIALARSGQTEAAVAAHRRAASMTQLASERVANTWLSKTLGAPK